MFEAAGWHVRDGQVRPAPARAVRARRRRGAARAHRRDGQRGVPAPAARRRRRAARAPARRRRRRSRAARRRASTTRRCCAAFRDLGGHDLGALLDGLPRGRRGRATARSVVFAYTIKGWSLPTEGHPSNHSALLNDDAVRDARRAARRRRRTTRGRAFDRRPPEGRAVRRGRRAPGARARSTRHDAAGGARRRSGARTRARARPSRRSAASSSTSRARRPRSPSTSSPSRPTSPRRPTSAAGSTRRRSGAVGERIDWFADDSDTLVRWRESDHGRHIELGIAEVNLVGLLGELGATWIARRAAAAAGRHDLRPVRRRARSSRGRSGSTPAGSRSSSARRPG